jgi:hypothetical protein
LAPTLAAEFPRTHLTGNSVNKGFYLLRCFKI